MNRRDPMLTVLEFNQAINDQDLDSLAALMTEGHRFIDSQGGVEEGRDHMIQSWRGFFKAFPEYKNVFVRVELRGEQVVVVGYSVCPKEQALDGPAIWTAKIEDDKMDEWRVYEDTAENRKALGIR